MFGPHWKFIVLAYWKRSLFILASDFLWNLSFRTGKPWLLQCTDLTKYVKSSVRETFDSRYWKFRLNIVIYVIKSHRIKFWGHRYTTSEILFNTVKDMSPVLNECTVSKGSRRKIITTFHNSLRTFLGSTVSTLQDC